AKRPVFASGTVSSRSRAATAEILLRYASSSNVPLPVALLASPAHASKNPAKSSFAWPTEDDEPAAGDSWPPPDSARISPAQAASGAFKNNRLCSTKPGASSLLLGSDLVSNGSRFINLLDWKNDCSRSVPVFAPRQLTRYCLDAA